MRRITVKLVIALAFLSMVEGALAQIKKKAPSTSENVPKVVSEADAPSVPLGGGEIVRAAEIYKTSLKQLLAAREAETLKASRQLETLKALYSDGLISKRELEDSELALLEMQHKVEEVRKQLTATDAVVVESLAENGSMAEFDAPRTSATLKKVAYVRYKGYANWSVSDAEKIQKFFSTKFRRPLPIVALGQSDLHSRWGYDHRNAVDVALHPDSSEGKALMNYLSSQGISFMAFRRAVSGSATGPHIHIGQPSQRTTNR